MTTLVQTRNAHNFNSGALITSSGLRYATRTLDHDRLRQLAPSVFATQPWQEVSSKYRFVPTIAVVEMLADRGFLPVRCEQSRTRIPGKQDFTRHMLRFRHSDYAISADMRVGDEIPEIVLTNSHDRTAAYQFSLGLFRLACSNGLIVQSATLGTISVRHCGEHDFSQHVLDATYQIVDNTPRVLETVNTWKTLALPAPAQNAYAEAALEITGKENIQPQQLLATRRAEDRRDDLWTVTNRVQENVMKGGLRGVTTTGRRQRTRAVNSVSEDSRINRALWTLTERMAEILKPSAN